MGRAAEDSEQMEQLRELIKVLLGVSAVKEDVTDIISDLFKLFHQLEVRCPQLSCHFHVSGVSQTTGDSFFVVVYDAALMASDEAKRVIKTVYTHLHSEESMVMTSALFRASLARTSRPARAHLPAEARPLLTAGKDQPMAAPSTPNLNPLDGPHAASDTLADTTADGAATGGDGEVSAEIEELENDDDRVADITITPPSASTSGALVASNGAAVGARFRAPDVHVPSDEANDAVEDLFTAVKGSWVGLLRSTLTAVLLALVAFHGLASKASLQGMLVWWPLDISSRNLADDEDAPKSKRGRRGRAGDRLRPQPFPVEVQRRHNPPGERRRDALNQTDVDYVFLSEVAPAGAHLIPIQEVVAMLLLLFDKEKTVVAAVIDKKLADHGVTRKEQKVPRAPDAMISLTMADVLNRGGFQSAPSRALSPPPSDLALVTPSEATAANSQPATQANSGNGVSAAVAARLAARRAAGVAGERALAAIRAAGAVKKAQLMASSSLKRSGAATSATTPKKRLRVGSAPVTRSDALASEFKQPDLQPKVGVESFPVLVEASMLADHTYLSLATNWPPLETDARLSATEVQTATTAEWGVIAEQQKELTTVLSEEAVRRARMELMAKAAEMRGCNAVELEQECPVYITVPTPSDAADLRVTAGTLQAMADLHAASLRLQLFRTAVEWLRVTAGYTSARVPDFSGSGHVSNGALANELVVAFQSWHPTDTIWRLESEADIGADQDVVVPAHLLIKNTQDVCMTDDIITVNTIILARWCISNRPDFRVLHCSFFVQLLVEQEEGIAGMANAVHADAGGATKLFGVCNINNAHWIGIGVDVSVSRKTVWIYDSGAHFKALQKDVTAAGKKMQLFGKYLLELMEDDALDADEAASTAKAAKAATDDDPSVPTAEDKTADVQKPIDHGGVNVEGGGPPHAVDEVEGAGDGLRADDAEGDNAPKAADEFKGTDEAKNAGDSKVAFASKCADESNDANVSEGAGEGRDAVMGKAREQPRTTAGADKADAVVKVKPWSTRRVKVPAQEDVTSCGPFAFSYLWHQAHEAHPTVLPCDAFSVRLSMLAAVVRDGQGRENTAAPVRAERP